MTLICPACRVPLKRSKRKPGAHFCPACKKRHTGDYWEKRQPNAKLTTKTLKTIKLITKKKVPDITHMGPQFKDGIRAALDKVLAGHRDRELVIEDIYALVNDNRQGEQGNTRVDEFDHKPIQEISAQLLEVLLAQELANLFGVEPWLKKLYFQHMLERMLPPKRPRQLPQQVAPPKDP